MVAVLGLSATSACNKSPTRPSSQSAAAASAPLSASSSSSAVASASVAPIKLAPPVSPLATGKWLPVKAAASCGPLIASDPVAAAPAPTWLPCASGRAGCRRWRVDWVPGPTGSPFSYDERAVQRAGGKAHFAYVKQHGSYAIAIVQPFDEPAIFVAAADTSANVSCTLHPAVGEAGVAATGSIDGEGRDRALDGKTLIVGMPWGKPSALTSRLAGHGDYGAATAEGSIERVVVGKASAYLETLGPTAVQPIDVTTLDIKLAIDHDRRALGVDDGALAIHAEIGSVDIVRPEGPYSRWVAPASGKTISAVAFDQTRHDAVAWLEANAGDPTYRGTTLWASPYTKDPAAVARRRVVDVPEMTGSGGRAMVLNAGVLLIRLDASRAAIYELGGEHAWLVRAEEGDAFIDPLWVDENEAVLATAKSGGTEATSVVRFARASLGASVAPSSL